MLKRKTPREFYSTLYRSFNFGETSYLVEKSDGRWKVSYDNGQIKVVGGYGSKIREQAFQMLMVTDALSMEVL